MDKADISHLSETAEMLQRLVDRIRTGEVGESVGVAAVVFADGNYTVWSFGRCHNSMQTNAMFDIGKLKLTQLHLQDDKNGDHLFADEEEEPVQRVYQ